MNTQPLPLDKWPLVEKIVTEVFGNKMPTDPARDTFVALMDGDRVAGFVHVEQIFHFDCVYVDPEYANRSKMAMQLIRDAAHSIPEGHSGIWLSDRRVDNIAEMVGARLVHSEEDGTDRYFVYRKDAVKGVQS
jgi:hypothetical protein